MKHKHADLIHAWADGQQIQYRQRFYGADVSEYTEWADDSYPDWDDEEFEFRIKPEEKKPVVRWLWAFKAEGAWRTMPKFYAEDELKSETPLIKLEWSRTEFPE